MKPRILLSGKSKLSNYSDAVNYAGGIATAKYLPEIDTSYDGLILCGGNDSDPKYYGEEINGSVNIDYKRDEVEFALADAFIKAGKAVMGICRGHQLLNIYFGGSLYQDLKNAKEHSSFADYDLIHTVTAKKESIAEQLYGNTFTVNSFHHQAIKKLGENLTPTIFSGDIIEGFEHKTLKVFGVQWHPERMCCSNKRDDTVDGAEIFKYFIQLCKNK